MNLFFGLFLLLITSAIPADAQVFRERRLLRNRNQENVTPSPPEYSDLYYWAAHPFKKDFSDSIPLPLLNEPRDSAVDVFFLHPTSYIKDLQNANMNADLRDAELNKATDAKTILMQASVFNASCRVFAPRYRQAHLKAFFRFKSQASQDALELAYQDLKKAFEYYLGHWNNGRPIIIASHSQGTIHAIRLLKEFFDGKPLQKKLVCAYLIGWQIKPDEFTSIPIGDSSGATNCFVGWRSYKMNETDRLVKNENGGSVCVNPVSWTTNTGLVPKSRHLGAVGKDFNGLHKELLDTKIDSRYQVLGVELPENFTGKFERLTNLHVADYNLFYLDIRNNVKERVNAYFKKYKREGS